jgi:Protein of unknown function (DUF742)
MAAHDDPPDEMWLDDDAGPVVRPYAVTRGRTRSSVGDFDLITLVVATQPVLALEHGLSPEHVTIVRLCQQPLSVAEISAHLNLPVGIVRVLLGDLMDEGLILAHQPQISAQGPSQRVLEAVINGLRSL